MAMPPLKIAIPAAVSVLVVVTVFVLTLLPLAHVIDFGRQLAFDEKMLGDHLTTVKPADGKVKFQSDGTLGRVKEEGGRFWLPEFVLAESDIFYSLPRRNSYTEFRVYKIEPDGVIIEYDAKLRARDNESKTVSVNHGMVRLAWKENDSRYTWPYPEKAPARD